MVAARRRLPDLAAQLRGRRRRRDRRPARDRRAPRPPRRAGRRRALALPHLPVAAGRRGLRHLRLPRHRPDVRHARGLRRAARGRARARHEADPGPRRQPHLRRAPVVRGVAREPRQPQARLVLVARAAEQLGVVLLRLGVGARPGDGRVLPAPVLAQAARPQLGEPGGPRRGVRADELVDRPRRRRVPDGRRRPALEGPGPAGRAGPARRAVRRRHAVLRLRAADPRVPGRDARSGLRRPRRRAADRRRDADRDARGRPPVHRPRRGASST